MTDAYELTLSVRLPATTPEHRLAALRGHLGDPGSLATLDAAPSSPALLDCAGELTEVPDGWVLTAHRSVRAEEFGPLGELLAELAGLTGIEGPVVLGQLRSPASEVAEPLLTRRGTVVWPVGAA
ncbi:hypothetical protein ACGFX4_03500 [Kitasatospora sp. NPDC048365]|uniref:hypothetical protein n=1 Tax=Kitasatospora sp. NPDC048365 TaxID=3364050 RepID=UPI00371FED34